MNRNGFSNDPNARCFNIVQTNSIDFFSVFLNEEVTEISEYYGLLEFLATVARDSFVTMHLANFGGSVQAGQALIAAIKRCKAHITMSVDAPCYSMGAILAVAGDDLIFEPATYLMFHNYSGGIHGKGKESLDQAVNFQKIFSRMLHETTTPFLTSREIKTIESDNDIYIYPDDKDLPRRMKRHFKSLKEKLEAI